MAERPEDLNLPNAVVARIIKEAIPEGVNVSKEAKLAISKAASVFVLYATSCSNNFALKNKRKTITAQDILSAMEDMEFEQFIEPLQQCQEAFRNEKLEKKKDKAHKPTLVAPQTEDDADNMEEVNDDEGGTEGQKKDDTPQSDDDNEDYIITVNNDLESSSSPEMMNATRSSCVVNRPTNFEFQNLRLCQSMPTVFSTEKLETKKDKAHKPTLVAPQTEDDADNMEEVNDNEGGTYRQKKDDTPQSDDDNEDYIITVNNDLESSSSPEMLDSGD
ncbi:hypothetical protein BsWGS_23678 [Bradybaena similaris]